MEVFWETREWAGAKLEAGVTCVAWMGLAEEGQGLVATGSASGAVGITRTDSRLCPAPPPARKRLNFNLRGHHSPITKVGWNAPQSKLATCDESGVIYVWVPYEERWSVELVNDRGVKVRDFSWSPSGSAALIAYEDNFVLIGSASGQRIWSNIFNEPISAGVWSPGSDQVLLASASGVLRLLTDNGASVSEHTLRGSIQRLAWSPCRPASEASTIAVVMEDGEVMLLAAVDDPDPASLASGLKVVALEWSRSGEHLLLGGYEERDGGWNGVIVVRYDGSVLMRSEVGRQWGWEGRLSGLCWLAEEEAIMVGMGERVATGRMVAGVPALSFLASRAVWGGVGERREGVAELPLPERLRSQTAAHSSHMVQCRVPPSANLLPAVLKGAAHRSFCTIVPEPRSPQTFTLCMEHMGGLVPILKGRQTNKLLPEFEIRVYRQPDAGPVEEAAADEPSTSAAASATLRPPGAPAFAPPTNFSRDTIWRRSKRKIADMVHKAQSFNPGPNPANPATQKEEKLLSINSNMWCTRFKMSGLNPALVPDYLGQVVYKTSVLHLQPRQMTVQVVDLGEGSGCAQRSDAAAEEVDVELEDPEPSTAEPPPIAPMESEIFLDQAPAGAQLSAASSTVVLGSREEEALVSDVFSEFNDLRTAVDSHIVRMRQFASDLTRSSAQLRAQPSPELAHLLQPTPFQRRGIQRPASTPHTALHLPSSASVQSSPPISLRPSTPSRLSAIRSSFIGRFHRSHSDRPSLPVSFFQSFSRKKRNRSQSRQPPVVVPPGPAEDPDEDPDQPSTSGLCQAAMPTPPPTREAEPPAPAGRKRRDDWEEKLEAIGFIDEDESVLVTEESERRRLRARALSCHATPGLVVTSSPSRRPSPSPRPSPALASFRRAFRPSVRRGESKQLKEISSVLDKLYKLANELKPKASALAERAERVGAGPSGSGPGSVEQRMGGGKVGPKGSVGPGLGAGQARMGEEEGDELRVRVREIAARVSQLEARLSAGNELLEDVRADLESRVGRIREVLGEESAKAPPSDPRRRLITLQNKAPFWNEQSQVYQLDFGGRVTQESAKNFQVELEDVQVMQFGRIENGCYTLDFQAPFCAAQAFAVALASITQRLK